MEENDIIKIAEPTDESSKYAINHKKIIEDAAKVGEPDALNNWGTGLFKTDKQKGMELQQQAIDLGYKKQPATWANICGWRRLKTILKQ